MNLALQQPAEPACMAYLVNRVTMYCQLTLYTCSFWLGTRLPSAPWSKHLAMDHGDTSRLSPDQQLALQQFSAITDQQPAVAVPILQRSQWNVNVCASQRTRRADRQIAIARFFDGEPEPVPDAARAETPPPPPPGRRQDTLAGAGARPSRAGRRFDAAPRIVPQPEAQATMAMPFLLSVVLAPLSLSYSFFTKVLWRAVPLLPRLLGALAPARGGRRPLNVRDTAARLRRELEEEYGPNELPLVECGYAQAFDAAKRDLHFLVVVLLAPEHDDTSPFVRDTLLHPDVVGFLRDARNNVVLWAGNVQDGEAYQVASEFRCTKFPCTALVVHTPQVSSTAMSVAVRISGPTPPAEYLAKLRRAMAANAEPLDRARAQRSQLQATRSLREEQNSAYERSLAQDRARAQQKRHEAETRARAEKAALERAAAKEHEARCAAEWRQWRAATLPAEPAPDDPDAVRIRLRMATDDRVVRRFAAAADLEQLYAFVDCYDVLSAGVPAVPPPPPEHYAHAFHFQLVSPVPREVYDVGAGGSIKDRVGRSGNLIVERTDLDESDDEAA